MFSLWWHPLAERSSADHPPRRPLLPMLDAPLVLDAPLASDKRNKSDIFISFDNDSERFFGDSS